jgi:hypothetical protein
LFVVEDCPVHYAMVSSISGLDDGTLSLSGDKQNVPRYINYLSPEQEPKPFKLKPLS